MRKLLTLALALICSGLAGCVVESDTATSYSDLDCGSFCDPADPMDAAAALDLVAFYVGWKFPKSIAVDAPTCANLGSDQAPDFECIQQIYIRQSACGPVAVSCYRGRCDYKIRCH